MVFPLPHGTEPRGREYVANNILAPQAVFRIGIFSEDITLGRSEPIREAVGVDTTGTYLAVYQSQHTIFMTAAI